MLLGWLFRPTRHHLVLYSLQRPISSMRIRVQLSSGSRMTGLACKIPTMKLVTPVILAIGKDLALLTTAMDQGSQRFGTSLVLCWSRTISRGPSRLLLPKLLAALGCSKCFGTSDHARFQKLRDIQVESGRMFLKELVQ
jgi:hypothetical protein